MSLLMEALDKARTQKEAYVPASFPLKSATLPINRLREDFFARVSSLLSHCSGKSLFRLAWGAALLVVCGAALWGARGFLDLQDRRMPSRLEGVYFDGREPVCLLEGKVLRVGDRWKDMVVSEIGSGTVRLKSANGKMFSLNV